MRFTTLLALATLVAPTVVAAQDYRETTRDTYTFLGHNLVIEVLTETPGMLSVMRGDPGEVRVAARARDGFAGYSMAGYDRERLHLTAVGAERVDYLVIVPVDTRVDVRLPNHMYPQSLGTLQKVSTYRWGSAPEAEVGARTVPRAPVTQPEAPESPVAPPVPVAPRAAPSTPVVRPAAPSSQVAFSAASAPRQVAIFGAALRHTTVRMEGDRFRVSSPSVLEIQPAGAGLLHIRAPEPAEIAIAIPLSTRDFVLRLDDQPVLVIKDGVARSLCLGATQQKLPGGRLWFTFSPVTSRECRAPNL
jgi:hypothetical protein